MKNIVLEKKIKSIIILFVILGIMTGCGKEGKSENVSEAQKVIDDTQHNYLEEAYFARIEGGCYAMDFDTLYFYDEKSKKSVPVCNKPNCKHEEDDPECDAYLNGAWKIVSEQGKLYTIKMQEREEKGYYDINLIQMDQDGSNREKLYTLKTIYEEQSEEINAGANQYDFTILGGAIYYSFDNWDLQKKNTTTLCKRALQKDAEEEVVYESQGYSIKLSNPKKWENELYFTEYGYKEKDGKKPYYDLRKLDENSGQTETILKDFWGNYTKIGDQIYAGNRKTKQIAAYNEKTKEQKDVIAVDDWENDMLYSDGEYLYLHNGETGDLTVYEEDGTKVSTVKNTPSQGYGMVGADDKYLYFSGTIENGKKGGLSICKREDILKGKRNLQWIKSVVYSES